MVQARVCSNPGGECLANQLSAEQRTALGFMLRVFGPGGRLELADTDDHDVTDNAAIGLDMAGGDMDDASVIVHTMKEILALGPKESCTLSAAAWGTIGEQ